MSKYIDQATLELALSPATFDLIFLDDPTSGSINQAAVNLVLDRAEGTVDSFLVGERDLGTLNPYDRLLRSAALEFALCFSYERKPEAERTLGDYPRGGGRFARAKAQMERIQAAIQELPDQPANAPANVGAIIRCDGPRTIVTSPDGTENGAGY